MLKPNLQLSIINVTCHSVCRTLGYHSVHIPKLRQHYSYKFDSAGKMASQTVSLVSMPTLSHQYRRQTLRPTRQSNTRFQPSSALNSKITLIKTSITDLEVTSIVNAANSSLLGGGGVVSDFHPNPNSCTDKRRTVLFMPLQDLTF